MTHIDLSSHDYMLSSLFPLNISNDQQQVLVDHLLSLLFPDEVSDYEESESSDDGVEIIALDYRSLYPSIIQASMILEHHGNESSDDYSADDENDNDDDDDDDDNKDDEQNLLNVSDDDVDSSAESALCDRVAAMMNNDEFVNIRSIISTTGAVFNNYSYHAIRRVLLWGARGRYDVVFEKVYRVKQSISGRMRLLEYPLDETLLPLAFATLQAMGTEGMSAIELSRRMADCLGADPPFASTRLSTFIDTMRLLECIHMRRDGRDRFPTLYIK